MTDAPAYLDINEGAKYTVQPVSAWRDKLASGPLPASSQIVDVELRAR